MAQLTIDRTGAAALLTLNRPEKRNALSIELRLALAKTVTELATDDTIAAIGLTGAGSSFCAGLEVTQFGGDPAHRELLVESSVRCFRAIAASPTPTVALINGPAIAGGFALALLCDIRVAAPAARVGFPKVGIHPGQLRRRRMVAPRRSRQRLCLTGRTLDAHEAFALRVVSRISAGGEALDDLGAVPPSATAEVKRRILQQRAGASPEQLLADEEWMLRAAVALSG